MSNDTKYTWSEERQRYLAEGSTPATVAEDSPPPKKKAAKKKAAKKK